ncbi:hypothetical protein ABMA28_009399 [Loxostege sticticalis]|uniref:Integrase catalytic domain-containing protein n=1 Tax=Loxostege sticticalis TaxID=481309 RepID=A0ABD0SD70_LOXSC
MAASTPNIDENMKTKQIASDSVQTSLDLGDFKEKYYAELTKHYESQTKTLVIKPWTKQKVLEVIQQVETAKVTMQSSVQRTLPKTYWHLRYDVVKIDDEEFLIMKKDKPGDPTIRVVPYEEYYDVLIKVHKDCEHGGCNKMYNLIKESHFVARRAIEIFVSLCPVCISKSNIPRKGIGGCYSLSNFNKSKGQIDLIDMQSVPDGQFKWILNYQDLNTRFVHLRPLCSKEASEVGFELLKIFLEFGVPSALQSSHGIEFTAKVIEEIAQLWPECKIIDCVSHQPQIQDSGECSDQDIENMVWSWMRNNTSPEWVTGCFFVQFIKNTMFHKDVGRSPFQAVFRSELIEQISDSLDVNRTELLVNLSSSVNKSPPPSHKKAQKRKNSSEDSDVSKESEITAKSRPSTIQNTEKSKLETESSELSKTVTLPSTLGQKPKKQKTTGTPRVETKSPELTQTLRSSVNTQYSSQNAIDDPSQTSQITDTSPTVESEHPELSRPVSSPVCIVPPSPPYQHGISNSPVYTFATSPSNQNAKNDPSSKCPELQTASASSIANKATSPAFAPCSPAYQPSSPTYMPSSPQYTSSSPANKPSSPQYTSSSQANKATSPAFVPCSPTYRLSSPTYMPSSPQYTSSSPVNKPSSPQYTSSSQVNKPTSPAFVPCSPTYQPSSPIYIPCSPQYTPFSQANKATSPVNKSTSPQYRVSSPTNKPSSPSYVPCSPTYQVSTPNYTPSSPQYTASTPIYRPLSPAYRPSSPTYPVSTPNYTPSSPSSPTYPVSTPNYTPSSPQYTASTPIYRPLSPAYRPSSPTYPVSTPNYTPSSPQYTASTPIYRPLSPAYRPSSPQNITLSSPSHQSEKNNFTRGVETIVQFLEKRLPITDIDYLFKYYAETLKKFPLKIQCEFKLELAKMFANAEIKILQNSMQTKNGTQTQMDAA